MQLSRVFARLCRWPGESAAAWRRLLAVPDQLHQIHTEMRRAMSTLTDEVIETLQLLPGLLNRNGELVALVAQLRTEGAANAAEIERAQSLAVELGPLNDQLAAVLGQVQADPDVPEVTPPTEPPPAPADPIESSIADELDDDEL